MLDPAERALVDRYLAGECTPADAERASALVAAHPEEHAAIRFALEQLDADAPASPHSAQHSFQALRARLGNAGPRSPVLATWWKGTGPSSHHRWPRGVGGGGPACWAQWMSLAVATAVVVLGFGSAIWPVTRGAAPQALREFTTPRGGRAAITLRDGTRLVLGPASRLHVPDDYGSGTRTVELAGEALFTVVHDIRHPFAVRTTAMTVHDVGTVFAVRAYADDALQQVAVEEGVVSLGTTTLRAHDVATVTAAGDAAVRVVHDVTPYVAWSQGRFAFSDTPLGDVARDLGRTFGLTVTVTDSTLSAKLITGSYTDEPVDAILADVTAAVGAQYERTGRAVIIRRRSRTTGHPRPDTHEALTTAAASREGHE